MQTAPIPASQVRRLPGHFARDASECGCDVGEIVSWHKGGQIDLSATPVQIDELISRAQYYLDPYGPDAVGDGGALKRSAKALLKALAKMAN